MRMREWFLRSLVTMAARRRLLVYVSSLVATLLLGGLSGLLRIDVRWSTLIPRSIPEVMEFEKIDQNFLQAGNMIVAISGPELTDTAMLEAITDEATEVLEAAMVCAPEKAAAECKAAGRLVRYVYGKMPEQWLTEHGIRLAEPKDVRRLADLMGDPRLAPYLTHLNDDLEAEFTDSEAVANQERQIVTSLDAIQALLDALAAAGNGEVDEARVQRTVRDLTVGRPYLFSLDNSMSLIMVAAAVSSDDFETLPIIDQQVEELLAPLNEKYPEYRLERTGLTAIGRDEMDSVGPQTQVITMLALLLIFLLLAWNFRSLLTPMLALLPIIIGIIWTMGVIAVTLGTLNLITVMIMVVLLGLGIDFTIHLCNRFGEEIAGGHEVEEALGRAVAGTGTGVVTGAVTTAIAFFALSFAETKGISEFGIAGGVGMLCTLAAALWILPALLAAVAIRRLEKGKAPKRALDFSPLGRFAARMGRWRYGVIIATVVVTGLGILAGTELQWEWNFMELEPKGLRSIALQDEIIDKFKLSISMSMLTAKSVEESRELRAKIKKKRLVGDVDDISSWVSRPDFEKSKPHIARLRESLAAERPAASLAGPEEPAKAGRAALVDQLDRMWANLVEIQALSFTAGQDRVVEKTKLLIASRDNRDEGRLKQVVAAFAKGDGIDWSGVQSFADSFARGLRARAQKMAAGEEPVTLEMVPEDIRARYVSKTADGYLLQFFPKENLYERYKLEAFQESVASVHPAITGFPQMVLIMSVETMREGKIAVLLALGVILLVLLIDFRRPLIAALTFIPLLVGLALTFGIMWLWGEKLNYLNMIGLPVIVGIGVDDGVHFFHRFIQEGRGNLERAVTSVGRAMLMTSLTTMIGFGSLMLYMMRGMASLGFVLFVGVGMCFLVTITLLPALATLFEKRIIKEGEK